MLHLRFGTDHAVFQISKYAATQGSLQHDKNLGKLSNRYILR